MKQRKLRVIHTDRPELCRIGDLSGEKNNDEKMLQKCAEIDTAPVIVRSVDC